MGYQFLFAGLPENVEYYATAGQATSKHFSFRVVDLPAVKAMQVTYHYPKWTGMRAVSEEQAGDLRALEGTEAELTVTMTSPLKDGMFQLDGGQTVQLDRRCEQHVSRHHQDDEGRRVPRRGGRPRPVRAPVRGLLHRHRKSRAADHRHRSSRRVTIKQARLKR